MLKVKHFPQKELGKLVLWGALAAKPPSGSHTKNHIGPELQRRDRDLAALPSAFREDLPRLLEAFGPLLWAGMRHSGSLAMAVLGWVLLLPCCTAGPLSWCRELWRRARCAAARGPAHAGQQRPEDPASPGCCTSAFCSNVSVTLHTAVKAESCFRAAVLVFVILRFPRGRKNEPFSSRIRSPAGK